jgi:hypothetical protein
MDLQFGTAISSEETVGFIEHVDGTGTIDANGQNVVINYTSEVI